MSRKKVKNLLSINDLSKNDINKILKEARNYKNSKSIKRNFKNEILTFLFFENSTRTKLSFELAAKKLGINTLNFNLNSSSLKKGESIYDTLKTLEAMGVSIICVRHTENYFPKNISNISAISIINAGDGTNEHPSQALLDLFTLKEKFGTIKKLKVGIVGDIIHSRVARSNIFALNKFGAKIFICGPKNLIPKNLNKYNVTKLTSVDELIKKVDVLITLRIQFERLNKKEFPSKKIYYKHFGITSGRIKKNNPKIYIMHPGPINREVEISSEVADSKNSLILEQVANGIPVRMGILNWILTK
ncbi:MAG: aspartate carbamoyltransferase catalytic subunit [Bacteroidetes bacterium]|nr:aspartate carbamoyltransferase catalytic subunit [Bacteroidota bacterium]